VNWLITTAGEFLGILKDNFIDKGKNAWRLFYSNADGNVVDLALGADGTYLKSNGASDAPSWDSAFGYEEVTIDEWGIATISGPGLIVLSSNTGTEDDLEKVIGLHRPDRAVFMAAEGHVIYFRKNSYLRLPSDLRLSGYRTITMLGVELEVRGDTCVGISDMANT